MAGEDFKLLESHENTVITKSGEIKTIYFYNNLLSDSEGNNTGLICSGSDITESKKAEEAMRISEERFRKVFEESQIGMAISAANLRFEKVNPAFCKMMGYTSEELTTMNFMSISHPDEVDFGVENIRTLEKGEISFYKVEKRYLTKSGEIIWVNVVVTNVRDKDGKLLYYLAMIEDITERRLAEAKLQASKDYLDKIINTVAYPILVKDEEHRFYLVNNASCEMFGHTKEEILGKTDFDFFPEEQAKEFQIRDKEVFYTGKENNNEEVLTDSNGNIRTLITTKTLYTAHISI
jgi:PAS domain S-box-containing protein